MAPTRTDLAERLADIGRRFDQRGWMLGTSGNLSGVVEREPLRLAITPSGVSKGELSADQILEIDATCRVTHGTGAPSAEARLHLEVVRARAAGAVLHTHSIWSALRSDRHAAAGGLAIEGYEMLKGLDGVKTHEHREWIPILDNDQDMSRLAGRLQNAFSENPGCHAFLLRRHGMHLGRVARAGRAPRRDRRVGVPGRRLPRLADATRPQVDHVEGSPGPSVGGRLPSRRATGRGLADVPGAFLRWRALGLDLGIFSSGSVLAQQLLFRYSSAGDLTGHLRWHFDTTTGAKTDAESYRRIAAAMTMPPQAVLFVSDVTRELDAARAAGLHTRLSVRPGNAPAPDGHGHAVIRTFDDVA